MVFSHLDRGKLESLLRDSSPYYWKLVQMSFAGVGQTGYKGASEITGGLEVGYLAARLPPGPRRFGWGFWPWWVLANAAGVAVGGVVVAAFLGLFFIGLLLRLEWVTGVSGIELFVALPLGGAVVGVSQWLVLTRQFPRVGSWALAAFVSWPTVGLVVVGPRSWLSSPGI